MFLGTGAPTQAALENFCHIATRLEYKKKRVNECKVLPTQRQALSRMSSLNIHGLSVGTLHHRQPPYAYLLLVSKREQCHILPPGKSSPATATQLTPSLPCHPSKTHFYCPFNVRHQLSFTLAPECLFGTKLGCSYAFKIRPFSCQNLGSFS